MAGSLRSLDAFREADVITSHVAALASEEAVLERYVFLPHARTGIAAALNVHFDWRAPIQATVVVRVPVVDNQGTEEAEMTVHVHGPAAVTEIDTRQVIRTHPKADVANAEVDDLVHVEFDRPDLPWLFTPTGPDEAQHLVPWVTLVVAERRHVTWGPQRGATRRAAIRRDQLQPLSDAWAWAHAQVMGHKPGAAAPAGTPSLEQRLGEANAPHNLARLMCPRRLEPDRAYVACVVPTFLVGRESGLGLQLSTQQLHPAWGTVDAFESGDPMAAVDLPVYFSWEFATGEAGNFESLARRICPAPAPPGVGRRRVDTSRPWVGGELAEGQPGREMVVEAPVVSLAPTPEGTWPSEANQQWPEPATNELTSRLNAPDANAHKPNPGPALVGPPLYGANHVRQPQVDPAQPEWFGQLNLDPRNRIVGGLGTRVVQLDQEDLMVSAWNQLPGLNATNEAVRLAQLARFVSASLHRRHLARMSEAAVLSVTERVHPKVLDAPERTVWAAVQASSLPAAVTSGAFRRLTRARGPLLRAALAETGPADRARAAEDLTIQSDQLTRDWVLPYVQPDGLSGLSAAARARITDEVAAVVAPGLDREALLEQWQDGLSAPAISDLMVPDVLAHAELPGTEEMGAAVATSVVDRLLATAPTPDEVAEDFEHALIGGANAFLLGAVAAVAEHAGMARWSLRRADVKRLGIEVESEAYDTDRVLVSVPALSSYANRIVQLVKRLGGHPPFGEWQRAGGRLGEMVRPAFADEGMRLRDSLLTIGDSVVTGDPLVAAPRDRLHGPSLGLVAKLDPARTVPARISARLLAGTGTLPAWLRHWFDDGRVEPVLAHPRFTHPMYEPLHRYDPEWMVPGLGLIERLDMATLLETNNRFIEAYLVGLNHEMGRELLWREFPTDQRGTYFSSFWTGQPELVADLHEPAWRAGALGYHVKGASQRLVFLVRGDLVRRYPGVVANAALETGKDDEGLPLFGTASPVETLFHAHLPPNVLLVGFDLTEARIATAGETWWFTLSENPTEPRFGLDPSRPPGDPDRDDLTWADLGMPAHGGFLDARRRTDHVFDGARWGATSAAVAYLLFQLPARAAFPAAKMVAGARGQQ